MSSWLELLIDYLAKLIDNFANSSANGSFQFCYSMKIGTFW